MHVSKYISQEKQRGKEHVNLQLEMFRHEIDNDEKSAFCLTPTGTVTKFVEVDNQ